MSTVFDPLTRFPVGTWVVFKHTKRPTPYRVVGRGAGIAGDTLVLESAQGRRRNAATYQVRAVQR